MRVFELQSPTFCARVEAHREHRALKAYSSLDLERWVETEGGKERSTDLDVDVSDEMISKIVANVHLGNFPEFAQLLEHFLEEVFKLADGKSET